MSRADLTSWVGACLLLVATASCVPETEVEVAVDDVVVFSSGRTGDGDLYVLDGSPDEPRLLVGLAESEGAPRWDPTSRRVVHSRYDSLGAMLLSGDSPLFRDPNGDVAPVWSSQGRIAYVRVDEGIEDVFAARPDGSGEVRLTDDAFIERYPAWSPDGSQLVYAKQLETGWDLHTLDIASTIETRLTFDATYVGHPSWSPTGAAIAFDRMYDGQTEIVVLRLDDLDMLRITDNQANDLLPAWSSDGTALVFAGERDGNWDVWRHDLEAATTDRLTTDPAFDGGPILVPRAAIR